MSNDSLAERGKELEEAFFRQMNQKLTDKLQAENRKITQANGEYQQQLNTLYRPVGAEEQTRQHGYVRPDGKVYVVAQPSPAPSPSPGPVDWIALSGA